MGFKVQDLRFRGAGLGFRVNWGMGFQLRVLGGGMLECAHCISTWPSRILDDSELHSTPVSLVHMMLAWTSLEQGTAPRNVA